MFRDCWRVLVLVLAALAVGCKETKTSGPPVASSPAGDQADSTGRPGSSAAGPVATQPSAASASGVTTRPAASLQDKAKALADAYVRENDLNWGAPTEVRQEGDHMIVRYATPKSEERELGPRILMVPNTADEVVPVRR